MPGACGASDIPTTATKKQQLFFITLAHVHGYLDEGTLKHHIKRTILASALVYDSVCTRKTTKKNTRNLSLAARVLCNGHKKGHNMQAAGDNVVPEAYINVPQSVCFDGIK